MKQKRKQMPIKNSTPFDFEKCRNGHPCKTRSGMPATFMFLMKDANSPLVMKVGGRMENYDNYGTHGFDSKLDLVEIVDPIDWDIDSPTNTGEPLSKFKQRNCLNKGKARNNESDLQIQIF